MRTTRAGARVVVAAPDPLIGRTRMILVPEKRKCFARLGETSVLPFFFSRESSPSPVSSIGTLETGTDSPVSIYSLTMASPESSTASQGKRASDGSAASNTSPGTRESESIVRPRVDAQSVAVSVELLPSNPSQRQTHTRRQPELRARM